MKDWIFGRRTKSTYRSRFGFDRDTFRESYISSSKYSFGRYYGGYRHDDIEVSDSSKSLRISILKDSYNNSKDLINIMNFPFKINLYFDTNGNYRNIYYHQNSDAERNIYLKTNGLFEGGVKNNTEFKEKIIKTISGSSIHEAGFIKFTTFNFVTSLFGDAKVKENSEIYFDGTENTQKILTRYYDYLPDSLDLQDELIRVIYIIYSIIEGVRVEKELLEERGGWIEYVEEYSEYIQSEIEKIFKKYYSSGTKDSIQEFYMILLKLLSKSPVPEDLINNYSSDLVGIDNYIGTSTSTVMSCKQSTEIFENYIMKFLLKKLKENKYKYIKSSDLISLDLINNYLVVLVGNYSGSDSEIKRDRPDLQKSFLGKESINAYFSKEELDLITGELLDGSLEDRVFFIREIGDPYKYDSLKKEISGYIPVFKNMISNINKNYEYVIHAQRNGKLDTNKLVEAYQGIPHVYTKQGKIITPGMNICVLIDESGSMWSEKREEKARVAAVLLNEAFGFINGINLFMYGHTADISSSGTTQIYTYREPGLYYNGMRPGCSLSQVQARCENRDGYAIKAVTKRVRKFTSQPVLMFILSDGNPSACKYRDGLAISDTKQKVEEAEKNGFNIIQVTISNRDCNPELMFSKYIDMTKDLSELPKKLGSVVKNSIAEILQKSQYNDIS